jgi:outer membrane receptor protein involved in Fe transport
MPDIFTGAGDVPSGYIGEQTENIDRARIEGVEASLRFDPSASFFVEGRWEIIDPMIQRDRGRPGLVDHQLAMTPRHQGQLVADWHASEIVHLKARVRFVGGEFQDNENLISLPSSVRFGLEASFRAAKNTELFLSAENIGNSRSDASRGANGLAYNDPPRMTSAGARVSW